MDDGKHVSKKVTQGEDLAAAINQHFAKIGLLPAPPCPMCQNAKWSVPGFLASFSAMHLGVVEGTEN